MGEREWLVVALFMVVMFVPAIIVELVGRCRTKQALRRLTLKSQGKPQVKD